MARKSFLDGTDGMKAIIFLKTKKYRKPIEGKVESWVKEAWATWEEEKPDWFTDQWKTRVPEYMKPTKKTGDVDSGRDSRETAAENEGKEALTVGGGDEQKGRRRSVLELISGQKAVKISPAGGKIRDEFDEAEFVRSIKRQGTMSM